MAGPAGVYQRDFSAALRKVERDGTADYSGADYGYAYGVISPLLRALSAG